MRIMWAVLNSSQSLFQDSYGYVFFDYSNRKYSLLKYETRLHSHIKTCWMNLKKKKIPKKYINEIMIKSLTMILFLLKFSVL